MPEKWTGELIGKMHNEQITYTELAKEMGVNKSYVGMLLNGRRNPPGTQKRMEDAVDAIIARRATRRSI
nr:MAG TPA: Helix-turn-helix XRE-family like protein [Caudoviricetes sp.]